MNNGLNNFFINFSNHFSMSGSDNGINMITMSTCSWDSKLYDNFLAMHGEQREESDDIMIHSDRKDLFFSLLFGTKMTTACVAVHFGLVLSVHFAMLSKRRSQVAIQKILFPRSYQLS